MTLSEDDIEILQEKLGSVWFRIHKRRRQWESQIWVKRFRREYSRDVLTTSFKVLRTLLFVFIKELWPNVNKFSFIFIYLSQPSFVALRSSLMTKMLLFDVTFPDRSPKHWGRRYHDNRIVAIDSKINGPILFRN